MSRCFPYPPPPPFYKEGLIESIKIVWIIVPFAEHAIGTGVVFVGSNQHALKTNKESEKAKKERRKENKREKKQKREKAGQEHEESKRSKHSHKKRKYEERSQLNEKDAYNAKVKAIAGAVEQLERSGLTEEHEQPYSIQNVYDSSESSQDSSKRRKLVATNVNQNSHGSILRIRLPLVKQKDTTLPTSMPNGKEKDLTPPASMLVLKRKDREPPAIVPTVKQKDLKPPTSNQTDLDLSRTSEEPCFSGRVTETALEMEAAKSPYSKSSSKRNRRIHEMERQFRELIVNWNPPPLQLEYSDIGNQDWLFGSSKQRSSLNSNMVKAHTEGSLSHGSSVPSSLQPQASYLPDFGTYQLPYVIPY